MRIVVLPGWASTEEFYRDTFDFDFAFDLKGISKDEEIAIVAWSMGTLKAFEAINKGYNIKKMILISPTKEFCSSMPKVVVKRMEKGIKRDKKIVIEDFLSRNFADEELALSYKERYMTNILDEDLDGLIEELEYLREASYNVGAIGIEALIVFGKKDQIISNENSIKSIESFSNYTLLEYDRGHNLLYSNKDLVEKIGSFLGDSKKTSS